MPKKKFPAAAPRSTLLPTKSLGTGFFFIVKDRPEPTPPSRSSKPALPLDDASFSVGGGMLVLDEMYF
jgi:hypothetical protein